MSSQKQHLLFVLHAPMMSWGTRTATDNRATDQVPTKSAVLGMVSAAIGIDREEYDRLQTIQDGYDVAFRLLRHGQVMTDYHTVLAGRRTKSKRDQLVMTRKQEVEHLSDHADSTIKGGTTLTFREYVADGMVVACLRRRNDKAPTLEQLREALIQPRWSLHFGRKCCVPSLPLNPRLVESGTFQDAFESLELNDVENSRTFDKFQLYCWEGDKSEFDGTPDTEIRHDNAKTKNYGIQTGPYRYGRRKEHRVLRQQKDV